MSFTLKKCEIFSSSISKASIFLKAFNDLEKLTTQQEIDQININRENTRQRLMIQINEYNNISVMAKEIVDKELDYLILFM